MEARKPPTSRRETRWWGWRVDGSKENPQRLVGGGGGQMKARRTNQRVTTTRWCGWRADVAGVASGGVGVAGVAGGRGGRAPNESQ
jgi:hypothetical protein